MNFGPGTYPGTMFWEWTGLAWQQRIPSLPSASIPCLGAARGDIAHRRVVYLDTMGVQPFPIYPLTPNHTWTYANGVLTQLSTPFEPSMRHGSAMAYDTARGVTVMFGGSNYTEYNPMGDTWEFDLGPTAGYTTFGTGCLGQNGRPVISAAGTEVPRTGSTFHISVTNLPFTGPAFLYLGLSNTNYLGYPLPLDLSFLGANNCPLFCSCESLQVLPNVLGSSTWSFAIPPIPGAVFFNQAIALDPSANNLGLTTSNGGRGVIGL